MIKKHIPNLLTSANLFSGCIATYQAFQGNLKLVACFVIISGLFDFLDGFAARLLDVKTEIGKELDSIADVVSFGLVPGAVFFQLLQNTTDITYLPYVGFFITVFSAIRLATFNTDARQAEDFIGLNTPMNTFFVISLPYLLEDYHLTFIDNQWFLCGTIILLCWLLTSKIKMFSMKLSGFSWTANKYRYTFILISAVCIAIGKFAAMPLVVILYIILSKFHFRKDREPVKQV